MPPMRRDALANREKILAATREAFRAEGLSVGVDEIARRAGVGTGTLYRHFPTKDALIDAIVAARFDELTQFATEALETGDAWSGFATFIEHAVALQARDRGFKDALVGRGRREAPRRRLHAAIEKLVARGIGAGVLRPDAERRDVVALLWATGRIVERDPKAVARFVAVHLDGLRAR